MGKLINRGSSGEWGSHGLGEFLRCPRAGVFNLRGEKGDDERDYFVRGNLGHTALAHLYQPRPGYLTPEQSIRAYAARNPSGFNARWVPRVEAMLAQYRVHYRGDSAWTPIDVERVLKITLPGDTPDAPRLPYSARYDLAVRWNGKVYLVDHKFTSVPIPQGVESYRMAGQILGLALIGRVKWKQEFGGVMLNFVRLTLTDVEFRRFNLPLAWEVVEDYKNTIREAHRLRTLYGARDPMAVPGVFGDACWGKYGPCAHRRKCGRGA